MLKDEEPNNVLPRASIVVPCYNEANRIEQERFRSYLSAHRSVRFVFVDDGSSDGTCEVLKQVAAGFEEQGVVLRLKKNRGKGEAVRHGILHSLDSFHQEFIGFWDADLATPLDAIDRFAALLDQRPDIEMVFGSRVKLLGRFVERRAIRHYLGRIFATVVSNVLRLPIYDTQCGAKLFRVGPRTRGVFAQKFLSRWVFDVEIIARYLQLYRKDVLSLEKAIYEYPLEKWVDVRGSKVHSADFFIAFLDVLRIKLKYLS